MRNYIQKCLLICCIQTSNDKQQNTNQSINQSIKKKKETKVFFVFFCFWKRQIIKQIINRMKARLSGSLQRISLTVSCTIIYIWRFFFFMLCFPYACFCKSKECFKRLENFKSFISNENDYEPR